MGLWPGAEIFAESHESGDGDRERNSHADSPDEREFMRAIRRMEIPTGNKHQTQRDPMGESPADPGDIASGHVQTCAPGKIRTSDQRIRNPLLYPLSYGRGSGGKLAREGTNSSRPCALGRPS